MKKSNNINKKIKIINLYNNKIILSSYKIKFNPKMKKHKDINKKI